MTAQITNQAEQVEVFYLTEYDPAALAGIAALMPQLDSSFSDAPMAEDRFNQRFARNQERAMIVAQAAGKIVGTATIAAFYEPAPEADGAYMGGFVVDKNARGLGVGNAIWDKLLEWTKDQGLPGFAFNTETHRQAAVRFYERHGAQQIDGTIGHYFVAIEETAQPADVPGEIASAYLGEQPANFKKLGDGIINDTFLAESNGGEKIVLQRLNEVFSEASVASYAAITQHLVDYGWPLPRLLTNGDGTFATTDTDGRLWRAFEYVESDGAVPAELSPEALWEVGRLLGRLHKDLASLDHAPSSPIEHFHDTDYHLGRLAELRDQLDPELRVLAGHTLGAYDHLPALPNNGQQAIHGDPQLSNILFRDKLPYTYIDLDTVMEGSIWMDLGDVVRASLENDIRAGRTLNFGRILTIVDGYRSVAQPDVDESTFYDNALIAIQKIALELTARFLNDVVDDSYFAWDATTFSSRRDNHAYRAGIQWQIYQAIVAERNK